MSESLYERMNALHGQIARLVEDMGETVYRSIEDEALKRVAIAADVDWTVEGTTIIEEIGLALQRERDVNRELRRRIAALERANPPVIPWQELEPGDAFRLSANHPREVLVRRVGNQLTTTEGVMSMPDACHVQRQS